MESLTDIIARVEKLAVAREEERQASASTPQLLPPEEQPTLPLDLPVIESPTLPEYIQAEAFLEVSGFFTPSSKRIKSIYIKEKKLREYTDEQGKRRTVKVEISANYKLGLPITSDLDYYRAFLKILGYALKAGQLTYDCRYSTMHGMPVTGGRGFRGLKPLWYNGVPP
jgi:hypothetical protein